MSKTIQGVELPRGYREVLRTTVGSELHGIGIAGTDDHDEMGICIEPPSEVLGLGTPFEQQTFRTQPEGVRSGHGDIDRTIYSLRKFAKLAASCNPTVLLPLFAPEEFVLHCDGIGTLLRLNADMFLSQRARATFGGYMTRQMENMGAGKSRGRPRPELVEAYGFDTKYAGHVIRLGLQGVELLRTGKLTLPMAEEDRATIIEIRTGKWTKEQVMLTAEVLRSLIDTTETVLPEQTDQTRINEFIVKTYFSVWTHKT